MIRNLATAKENRDGRTFRFDVDVPLKAKLYRIEPKPSGPEIPASDRKLSAIHGGCGAAPGC
jgi:hypothetical protein